jgi:hypothetical protein
VFANRRRELMAVGAKRDESAVRVLKLQHAVLGQRQQL